jgi:hypothetical protein
MSALYNKTPEISSGPSNSNFEFLKNFQVAKACSFYEKNHPISLKYG